LLPGHLAVEDFTRLQGWASLVALPSSPTSHQRPGCASPRFSARNTGLPHIGQRRTFWRRPVNGHVTRGGSDISLPPGQRDIQLGVLGGDSPELEEHVDDRLAIAFVLLLKQGSELFVTGAPALHSSTMLDGLSA